MLQLNKLVTSIIEQGIGEDEHCAGPQLREAGKRFLDLLLIGDMLN
jgi:hypothetical protein